MNTKSVGFAVVVDCNIRASEHTRSRETGSPSVGYMNIYLWLGLYCSLVSISFTYDHRFENIALPVRSAVLKLVTGGLVVRWVTTSESPLLYVLQFLFARMSRSDRPCIFCLNASSVKQVLL
jgi:hypothetical protein